MARAQAERRGGEPRIGERATLALQRLRIKGLREELHRQRLRVLLLQALLALVQSDKPEGD